MSSWYAVAASLSLQPLWLPASGTLVSGRPCTQREGLGAVESLASPLPLSPHPVTCVSPLIPYNPLPAHCPVDRARGIGLPDYSSVSGRLVGLVAQSFPPSRSPYP